MTPENYRLLYELDGAVIGLDEMQLLDSPPSGRALELRRLLECDDDWAAFQAALVLTAWADTSGLSYFESILTNWPADGRGFFPHRLRGYDNACDEIAYAIHLFRLSGGDIARARAAYRQLLSLYGPVPFESRLKYALLKVDGVELKNDVHSAILRAEEAGKHYMASQLLPVLARWSGNESMTLLQHFLSVSDDPSPRVNVAEALRYLSEDLAVPLLRQLMADSDRVVSDEARDSLKAIGSGL